MARAEAELEGRKSRLRHMLQAEQVSLQQELDSQRVNPASADACGGEETRPGQGAGEAAAGERADHEAVEGGCDPHPSKQL